MDGWGADELEGGGGARALLNEWMERGWMRKATVELMCKIMRISRMISHILPIGQVLYLSSYLLCCGWMEGKTDA